jgi:Fic family protein
VNRLLFAEDFAGMGKMRYIYERDVWPDFSWDAREISPVLARVHYAEGVLFGRLSAIDVSAKEEMLLNAVSVELQKSYEIEGEMLDISKIRSSFANRLNISIADKAYSTKEIDCFVDILLDAVQNYSDVLTPERLFGWHEKMFDGEIGGLYKVSAGEYRKTEMNVVSGRFGRERIHFKAPDAELVPGEMRKFLNFVDANTAQDPIIKAIIAHLWFVTIHPFDDGNGRLTRVITEMLLARGRGCADRLYSVSSQIMKERGNYYDILEKTQKGDGDITEWLLWFLLCMEKSIDAAQMSMDNVFTKGIFWQKNIDLALNARQKQMINLLFDGFDGKLTTLKWAKITKCSVDTALRDINDLIGKGVLAQDDGGGKNIGYIFIPSHKRS